MLQILSEGVIWGNSYFKSFKGYYKDGDSYIKKEDEQAQIWNFNLNPSQLKIITDV